MSLLETDPLLYSGFILIWDKRRIVYNCIHTSANSTGGKLSAPGRNDVESGRDKSPPWSNPHLVIDGCYLWLTYSEITAKNWQSNGGVQSKTCFPSNPAARNGICFVAMLGTGCKLMPVSIDSEARRCWCIYS